MSSTPLVASGEPLTHLIEVRPPYFALESLVLERAGHVHAQVASEHPRGLEHGPIAAAEAGRHLAILGACACASLAPAAGKHYYLAHRARLERASRTTEPRSGKLLVEARGTRDKRVASAECVLREAHGASLFTLSVSYQVIPERVFQRMFAAHRRELRAQSRRDQEASPSVALLKLRQNPYVRPLPLDVERVSPEVGMAVLRDIPPQICAGHFPLYPAMPIALLMHGLSTMCGAVLEARLGPDVRYTVNRADVAAERLAFAGQSLSFHARCAHESGPHTTFETRATLADGSLVGHMQVTLERT